MQLDLYMAEARKKIVRNFGPDELEILDKLNNG